MTLNYLDHDDNNVQEYEEESKLEKIRNILEDIVFSKAGISTIRFIGGWIIHGLLGIGILIIPLYILDNFVPSVPMDIKMNEYLIINGIASFWFTVAYSAAISTNNSWIFRHLNQIPKLSKKIATIEDTLNMEQIMKKARDNESLLVFMKYVNAIIKNEDPKLYEIIKKEIEKEKSTNDLSIKKVGLEFYQDNKKIKEDVKKIKKKLGMPEESLNSEYEEEL